MIFYTFFPLCVYVINMFVRIIFINLLVLYLDVYNHMFSCRVSTEMEDSSLVSRFV